MTTKETRQRLELMAATMEARARNFAAVPRNASKARRRELVALAANAQDDAEAIRVVLESELAARQRVGDLEAERRLAHERIENEKHATKVALANLAEAERRAEQWREKYYLHTPDPGISGR